MLYVGGIGAITPSRFLVQGLSFLIEYFFFFVGMFRLIHLSTAGDNLDWNRRGDCFHHSTDHHPSTTF